MLFEHYFIYKQKGRNSRCLIPKILEQHCPEALALCYSAWTWDAMMLTPLNSPAEDLHESWCQRSLPPPQSVNKDCTRARDTNIPLPRLDWGGWGWGQPECCVPILWSVHHGCIVPLSLLPQSYNHFDSDDLCKDQMSELFSLKLRLGKARQEESPWFCIPVLLAHECWLSQIKLLAVQPARVQGEKKKCEHFY